MKRLLYILLLAAFAFVGCAKEEEPLFGGTDNGLISLSVTANGVTYDASISGDKITLSAPVGADLSGAVATYALCEHASILPEPTTIKDWNSQHVFRIKSHAKTPREYTYTVSRSEVAQSGNVQLLTQTDVEKFAKLGITVINGNLVIGSDSKPVKDSIVNLEQLSSVKEVRYNIIVNRSFAGGTLRGLERIEKCGGLHLGTTASAVEFPALSGISIHMPMLQSIGDMVLNSHSIKSLSFEKLESTATLYIASNSLVTLNLPTLKETVGVLSLANSAGSANSILAQLSFPKLEKVGGNLSLQYFSGLTEVDFPKLSYVGGSVDVALNSGTLETLAFPELATVNGAVVIERAPGLLQLEIPKIKQMASFIFNKSSYGSYPLERLDLSALETLTDELYIRNIPIENLTIANLKEVGGEVTFWDLKLATKISLPSIKKIGKRLQLYSTVKLRSLDISTLDTLSKLELIGCVSLSAIKSPVSMGNLTLNYASSAECVTPTFDGLQSIDGTLALSNDDKIEVFDFPNIKTIGTLEFRGGAVGAVLNLLHTEKIGTFALSSSNIETLNAPKLAAVEAIKFSYISKLTTLNIPLLKTVGTFSLSEHNAWGAASARMTHLDAYSGITSIGSVSISYCNKLIDFTGLAGVIPTLDAKSWSVSTCDYNPTYQDMVDRKYVKP